MAKRNIIQEMEKGLFKKDSISSDKTETNILEGLDDDSNAEANNHITEPSSLDFYFYDYTHKINDPIENKAEFGPFESYDDVYGIFSYNSGRLYALSNNPDESLFVNSEEYDPFQKVPIADGDVLKIANFRYVISDQKYFLHQHAKKVMGKLLVKKSTLGTQKTLDEREAEITSFENKIKERQAIIHSFEEKLLKIDQNKKKSIELRLKIKNWILDIEESKKIIIAVDKETLELSQTDNEKEIDEQENEIRRLQEIKGSLVEKANLAKARLNQMQEAEERKKAKISSALLDIEKEEEVLKNKLAELEKKKNSLGD